MGKCCCVLCWDVGLNLFQCDAALAAVLVSAGHSGQMIAKVTPWAYAKVCGLEQVNKHAGVG